MTFLIIIFYIIPTLICWTYLYTLWKDLDLDDNLQLYFFIMCLIFSILPITDIIMALIISIIYLIRKNE